jgi:uncharacterized phage protein (TIGR02220 family)
MSKSPAFQTYSADYYMDTNSWTIEEMGIYQRLLLTEWVNGALPDDRVRLARIAGCSLKKFHAAWPTINVKFTKYDSLLDSKNGLYFQVDDTLTGKGYLINIRMEKEREKQRKYKELQSKKGKKSAELRSTAVEAPVEATLQPKVNSSVFSLLSSKEDILSGTEEIVNYLNLKTGKNFSHKTKNTVSHIHARFSEGRTVDDFKKVIDIKSNKWLTDPKMRDYLRPDTLFGTKFESYLNEKTAIQINNNFKDDFVNCKDCGARRYKNDVDENGICRGKCEVKK